METSYDVVVIGSGMAGLSYALEVAENARVCLVTKRAADESNTRHAQGGIATVWSPEDTFDEHVRDTLEAGAGLCHRDAVELTVREGPERVRRLIELGVEFTRRHGSEELDLGREGGHSRRRVLHAADMTGREVVRALLAKVRAHPRIDLREHHMAIDLITLRRLRRKAIERPEDDRCLGVYVLDVQRNKIEVLVSRACMLATGGSGKVYLYTSNPDVATGDGLAMAWRAGARVANMEFFQFHPTCLYHPQAKSFLISEALRGEGGVLRRLDGTAFMKGYHSMADLAPRDVVARAIDAELKRTGDEHVLLDMTHLPCDFLRERFPGIHERLVGYGIDMCREPIPVVPAAHYQCGGVLTDLDGRTSIPGLFAAGEVACTGLHGANRLASNSLLEAAVFAHRAARATQSWFEEPGWDGEPDVPPWTAGHAVDPDEAVVISQAWDEIRRFMWNYVGIVRSNKRLARARRRIALAQSEVHEDYWQYLINRDLIELRNIATVAGLIIDSASMRQESRGLHYNVDYPDRDDVNWLRDTVLWRGLR